MVCLHLFGTIKNLRSTQTPSVAQSTSELHARIDLLQLCHVVLQMIIIIISTTIIFYKRKTPGDDLEIRGEF